MLFLRLVMVFILFSSLGCTGKDAPVVDGRINITTPVQPASQNIYNERAGKGALLLTRFASLEEFKKTVSVQYADNISEPSSPSNNHHQVQLTYRSGGREISSILKSGISQADFVQARNSTIWKKIGVGLKCPYALVHKKKLLAIEHLGRRRPPLFGKGDAAFYDLAETMVRNIRDEDVLDMSCEELSEKGYLNTFNHITAQAFMTCIFSESLADFVADVHELYNMPQLITGNFTDAQLADFVNGPVDNYIDMINNEWGQELGKVLKIKYAINQQTYWTAELLTNVLNEIQGYHSWAFQIGFKPFKPEDEMVKQFAWKINTVLASS